MVFFQGYCRFNSFVCYFLAVFRKKVNIVNICLGYILYWSILSSFILNNWYCKCLLQLSGDIEWNSVLQRNSCKHLSICYWNLSSINSHNFVKASLLTVYNSIHKFNIICLSQTYVNSKTLSNDESLSVTGYNLIKVDHPSNTKHGGTWIYFKE